MTQITTMAVRRPSWLQRYLAPVPDRVIPWSGPEIVLGILLAWYFLPLLVLGVLQVSGFLRAMYGPEITAASIDVASTIGLGATPETELLAGGQGTTTVETIQHLIVRSRLWLPLFALPLQLIVLPLLLFVVSGTRPAQLGLTLQHGWHNVALGAMAAAALIPLVYALYFVVLLLFKRWDIGEIQTHPFLEVGGQLKPIEWLPFLFAVLVSAPVMEELTLRGLLQPWLGQRPWGGFLAAGLALALAIVYRLTGLKEASDSGDWSKFAIELQPALFVLVLASGFGLLHWFGVNRAEKRGHSRAEKRATSLTHWNREEEPVIGLTATLGVPSGSRKSAKNGLIRKRG